jgi:pentatricopeptide repeat protein
MASSSAHLSIVAIRSSRLYKTNSILRRYCHSTYVNDSTIPRTISRTANTIVNRSFSALATTTPFSSTAAFEHCQFTVSSPSPNNSKGSAFNDWSYFSRIDNHLRRHQQPHHHHHHQHNQVRFRRHDRSSAFSKPRPKTKKQRQAYNRRMKRLNDDEARWNPPGSKAGPRRQWAKDRWNQLLETASASETNANNNALALPFQSNDLVVGNDGDDNDDDDEYTLEDALLEEMMSNTAHVTSQPTPEPVYLGHKHKKYYNRVANQMDVYREALDEAKQQQKAATNSVAEEQTFSSKSLIDTSSIADLLPSDKDVSLVLRSYRDRHGTRKNPIGVAAALKHVLQDLGVPTTIFGEYTYTALLTCCRTPKEARRIFQLILANGHEVSPYAWSILVDVHSKIGDYEGCAAVLKEMVEKGGHAPTMAAYTSLLAACYKVCSDHGRIPHAVRAHAGKIGWEHWKEMIIVGIEPDAMAYGAVLRLCAARGHPERAINLLEDMQRFQVKPTTLCFTAALKAVAKSHETSIRFENGSSRKQLRRETIAAHHGKMARSIVIMAETAEVEQDDGFVSALMLCAAAAGDSATTKAVYLASEVRKMHQLYSIGSPDALLTGNKDDDHRDLLVGETVLLDEKMDGKVQGSSTVQTTDTSVLPSVSLTASSHKNGPSVVTFGEREYGKDTRIISALLHASSNAMNKNGIGTIWAGRENLGYLCDNSLRLITQRWEPSYRDTSIPGTDSTQVGISALKRLDDTERDADPKPGKRKKFRGLYIDDDEILTIDDIDNDLDHTSNESFAMDNMEDDDDDDDFFETGSNDSEFHISHASVPTMKVWKICVLMMPFFFARCQNGFFSSFDENIFCSFSGSMDGYSNDGFEYTF